MAQLARIYGYFIVSPAESTGDLCPSCFLPSIVAVRVHLLTNTGVRDFRAYRTCTDCEDTP